LTYYTSIQYRSLYGTDQCKNRSMQVVRVSFVFRKFRIQASFGVLAILSTFCAFPHPFHAYSVNSSRRHPSYKSVPYPVLAWSGKLLLVLGSTIVLGYKSRRNHSYIILSHNWGVMQHFLSSPTNLQQPSHLI
jgi:hypothetical protein